jgi:hypothetical protein
MNRKILTQFIIRNYRDNTCGTEGGSTLTSFRYNTNTKNTDLNNAEHTEVPPNFSAPDNGRVGRNMWCSDEF